ncbi:DUF4833 domain-containing protein [Corallibacter sp.]|uniref:DUF4833 domain-containing protein n=1 Tax=Corallibacter sp. TaxID=2038084 RepID=UPI003AB46C15
MRIYFYNFRFKACFLFVVFVFGYGFCQTDYPTPPITTTTLFYIQHSNNYNTYMYDARMQDGAILPENPVEAYRIVYTEGGIKKPLTEIQKRLAYGIRYTKLTTNFYELELAAQKQTPLFLVLDDSGTPKVYTTINKRKMFINNMFIQLKNKNPLLGFEVRYIRFEGTDYYTGATTKEVLLIEN